jgi:hypothetical protein
VSVRSAREIEVALTKKDFKVIENDHKWLWFYYKGKKTTIKTKLSHGVSDYGDNLLGFMARQLKLQKRQLDLLLDCPMDAEKYAAILIAAHILRP